MGLFRGVLIPVLLLALLLTGCSAFASGARPAPVREGSDKPDDVPPVAVVDNPVPQPAWATPITDTNFEAVVAKHRPNELGKVLILEYHDFKDVEERWARRWDNFRKDLEMLYAKGYRAVNLLDYLAGDMPLPAGTSPVIFTFDDSLLSQVKLKQQNGRWEADPVSAVGVMLQFQKEHPDFGVAGTFYGNFTPVPFRERENWQEKIHFLVEHGFEIANHAVYHEDLSSLDDQGVQEALAEQVRRLREVLPEYDGSTLALPFGAWPEKEELAAKGQWDGTAYNHRAVLLAGSDPVYSPYDIRLDVMALPRVQAIESEFERWMPFLDDYRYISDGDPDTIVIPDDMQERLNPGRTSSKKVRIYRANP